MGELQTNHQISAKSAMLVRKPVAEVFEAFVDPAQITQFWFTKSSGRIEVGQPLLWEWEMYHVSTAVAVQAVVPNERIQFVWDGYDSPTTVEWRFQPHGRDATFVSIEEHGFTATGDTLIEQVAESAGGWTIVLAGLKAYLEHGIRLNLVADRHPAGL